MLSERCPLCGSYDAECVNDEPVDDCRCGRCASVKIDKISAESEKLRAEIAMLETGDPGKRLDGYRDLGRQVAAALDARGAALAENERLRAENERLRALLDMIVAVDPCGRPLYCTANGVLQKMPKRVEVAVSRYLRESDGAIDAK